MQIATQPQPKTIRVRYVEWMFVGGVKDDVVLWPADEIHDSMFDIYVTITIRPRTVLNDVGRDIGHKGSLITIYREHLLSFTVTERDMLDPSTAPDGPANKEA